MIRLNANDGSKPLVRFMNSERPTMTEVMSDGPEIGESCHARCRKATKPVTVLEVDDEVTREAIHDGQGQRTVRNVNQ